MMKTNVWILKSELKKKNSGLYDKIDRDSMDCKTSPFGSLQSTPLQHTRPHV